MQHGSSIVQLSWCGNTLKQKKNKWNKLQRKNIKTKELIKSLNEKNKNELTVTLIFFNKQNNNKEQK